MADFDFYIDIEDSAGDKQGPGPITSASKWTYTARMDRAGTFSFAMPAIDSMAAEVTKKRIARAYALLDGAWTEVGAGIIDNIVKQPQADGSVVLSVSGDSEERELTYRTVGFLQLVSAGAAITHSAALTAIGALAPSGWTFTADADPGNDSIYGQFAGESVLSALVSLAELSQSHFYRSAAKTLTYASSFSSSGVRAVRGGGDLASELCAITSLQETINTYDLLSRIYPYGAGQGRARLTLAATSQSAPAGYTLSKSDNYIKHDATETAYGRIERVLEYKDVAPISNSDSDLEAAADMLYAMALKELEARSTDIVQATYALNLAQCAQLLKPLQTLRVVYFDDDAGLDIDAELNILESTIQVDANGLRTTSVVVSNTDSWPESDAEVLAANMEQGMVYQAHPQLNANSYTTGYTKNVDEDYNAEMRFRLGAEVAQVQQVVLDFQLLPFESTVKTVGGETSGSGTISTGAPSTNSSGQPSNNTSGAATGNTGAATGSTAGPSNNNTGAASGDTGAASGDTGAASGDTGAASGDTGGSGTLTTDGPDGDDIEVSGDHEHHTEITTGAASVTYPVGFGAGGTAGGLVTTYGSADTFDLPVNQAGDHTHDLGNHTHDLNSHAHSLNSHTHSLNSHAHSLNSHTHSLNSHTHSLNNHTHDLNSHTHDLNNHTHSLNDHTHDLSESLEAVYGIYQQSNDLTCDLDDLQYRINSGSWQECSGAVALGDDWYQLDITDDIVDSDTYRPMQASNLIEFQVNSESGYFEHVPSVIGISSGEVSSIETSYTGSLPVVGHVVTIVSGIAGLSGYAELTDVELSVEDTLTLSWVTSAANGTYGNSDTTVTYDAPMATIDALLSVRNIIQAIAYT